MHETTKTPEIKVSLTIRGQKAERIRLLKHVIGLSTDADILQHLIQRGMSAEAATFSAWEMGQKAQAGMLETFAHMGEQMKIMLENE